MLKQLKNSAVEWKLMEDVSELIILSQKELTPQHLAFTWGNQRMSMIAEAAVAGVKVVVVEEESKLLLKNFRFLNFMYGIVN